MYTTPAVGLAGASVGNGSSACTDAGNPGESIEHSNATHATQTDPQPSTDEPASTGATAAGASIKALAAEALASGTSIMALASITDNFKRLISADLFLR